jgi:hypothetical protein
MTSNAQGAALVTGASSGTGAEPLAPRGRRPLSPDRRRLIHPADRRAGVEDSQQRGTRSRALSRSAAQVHLLGTFPNIRPHGGRQRS